MTLGMYDFAELDDIDNEEEAIMNYDDYLDYFGEDNYDDFIDYFAEDDDLFDDGDYYTGPTFMEYDD